MKLRSVFIVISLFTILSGCATLHLGRDYEYYSQQGDKLASSGEHNKAIDQYKRAIRINPNAIETRRKLAELYSSIGNTELALKEFSEILKIEPRYVHAYNYRGYIFINQGRWEDAINEFERALQVEPDNIYALNHKGLSLRMLKRLDEARSTLLRAAELDPQMEDPESKNTHNYLGLVYKDENRLSEAESEFKKTLEKFPTDVDAHNHLGEILERQQRFSEAIAEYNAVIAIDPDNDFAKSRLEALKRSGSFEIPPVDIVKDDIDSYISSAPDPSKYPNAGAIVLLDKVSYEILSTGRTRYTIHWLVKILNDIGIAEYGEIAVPFNSRYQNIGVNVARTILPDGRSIPASLDAYRDITLPGQYEYNMYSDIMLKVVSMPALQPGAIIEFMVTLEDAELMFEKPWIWGSMNFQSIEPILNAKCILRLPKNYKIKWKLKNCNIEPIITEEQDTMTYIWISKDNPEIRIEPAMPPIEDIIPNLIFSSSESWDDVYQWYKELATPQEKFDSVFLFGIGAIELPDGPVTEKLIEEFKRNGISLSQDAVIVCEVPNERWMITDNERIYSIKREEDSLNVYDEIVKQKVNELVKDKATLEDKIKAIYDFVASQIRYVAIELGQGAYQPYAASEVLKYRYGDCKDKTTLLVSMLRHIGVKAYQVLLNPAPGRSVDLDVPSIGQFSHVIAVIPKENGDYIWLDPTVPTCKFGDLPASDQGRKAFIIAEDKGIFVDTPVFSSEVNKISSHTEIKMFEDGSIEGWEQTIANGQHDIQLRAIYRLVKPDKLKELFGIMINRRYPGAKIEGFELPDLYETDDPIKVKIIFRCPNYALSSQGILVIPIPSEDFSSYTELVSLPSARLYDIHIGYKMSFEKDMTITIPEDYEVLYMPNEVSFEKEFGKFKRKYERINSSTVRYYAYLEFSNHVITPDNYESMKNMLETAAKEDRAQIVIAKRRIVN